MSYKDVILVSVLYHSRETTPKWRNGIVPALIVLIWVFFVHGGLNLCSRVEIIFFSDAVALWYSLRLWSGLSEVKTIGGRRGDRDTE